MMKIRFRDGACLMVEKSLQFEHYARKTRKCLEAFVRSPGERLAQIELFRVLQVTGLLYREVGRRYGSSYGESADRLRESAKEAIEYLPNKRGSSSLLRDIGYYLTLLSEKPSCNRTKTSCSSPLKKVAG